MKFKSKIIFLVFNLVILQAKNQITFQLTKGRLGDQMIVYAQTLWFAKVYDLDFYYTPFKRSENFALHTMHQPFYNANNNFYNKELITKETDLYSKASQSTLWINTLNTKKSPFLNLDSVQTVALEYPWFKKMLQQHFSPTVAVKQIKIPDKYISVAIHVRTGSGTDKGCVSKQLFDTLEYYGLSETIIDKSNLNLLFSDERYPNKFPPYQFYIDQIDLLTALFPDKKFFIYIFTDHKNPHFVANLLAMNVQAKTRCFFETHSPEIQEAISVEDDFFGMAQFSILIRAGSNLSRSAQLFGNHKIVIYIKKARWHGNAIVPDNIGIIIYNEINGKYKDINLETLNMRNKIALDSIRKAIRELPLIL